MNINDVAHVLQLALTPALVLTGLGAIMNLINARIMSLAGRTHQLVEVLKDSAHNKDDFYRNEFSIQMRRFKLLSLSLYACGFSVFTVTAIIAIIYAGNLFYDSVVVGEAVGWLFGASLLSLAISLALLLYEVQSCLSFGTKSVKFE